MDPAYESENQMSLKILGKLFVDYGGIWNSSSGIADGDFVSNSFHFFICFGNVGNCGVGNCSLGYEENKR